MKGWKLKRDRDVGAIPGVRRKGVGRGIMVGRRVFAHMEMIRTLRLFTEQRGGGEGGRSKATKKRTMHIVLVVTCTSLPY